MIVVIADDLTGAAELGGLGLRYGLKVEINTEVNVHSGADLLIVSTDTRSMEKQEAIEAIADITQRVAQIKPQLIFKKVDSVLRGHIVAELTTQLAQLNLNTALLVPANPASGRTLTNGTYYINGQPVHLSSFSNDPEFAITSSNVLDMLGIDVTEIYIKKKDEQWPETGVIVGEVENNADLKAWAQRVNDKILAAGASGFFTAILDKLFANENQPVDLNPPDVLYPALYLSGTTFNKKIEDIRKIKSDGGPVSYMPSQVINSPNPTVDAYNKWADEVAVLLTNNKKAIIAIDPNTVHGKETALSLRTKTAKAVEKIFDRIYIGELFVEGGSTAAAIIKRLNFNCLYPVKEYVPGVVRMSVEEKQNLYLTIKPGSYDWPASIWNF